MMLEINKLYSSQALFNKTVDELNADEAKAFSIIESTIANRVKFEPYPIPNTVEDKHWCLFCVKRSFDPVSQQTHQMRLFLLMNMQSSAKALQT